MILKAFISSVTAGYPRWQQLLSGGDSKGGINLQAPSQEVETTHHGLVVVTYEYENVLNSQWQDFAHYSHFG